MKYFKNKIDQTLVKSDLHIFITLKIEQWLKFTYQNIRLNFLKALISLQLF